MASGGGDSSDALIRRLRPIRSGVKVPPCWLDDMRYALGADGRCRIAAVDWYALGFSVRTGMLEIDSNAPEAIIERDRLDTTRNIEV